jgi:hypothetical protein
MAAGVQGEGTDRPLAPEPAQDGGEAEGENSVSSSGLTPTNARERAEEDWLIMEPEINQTTESACSNLRAHKADQLSRL